MFEHYGCDASLANLVDLYSAILAESNVESIENENASYLPAIIALPDGKRTLHRAQLGIAPPNSGKSLHDFLDHRVTNVEEPTKWPWLDAIETSRCIVPLTSFQIGSFWGDPEGTQIEFRTSDDTVLHTAGVYRSWQPTGSGNAICTLSFVARPASDYVLDHGADRHPIFLEAAGIDAWIDPQAVTTDEALKRLRRQSMVPKLSHRFIRDLPSDWSRTQNGRVRRRGQTMAAQDRCPHACGF